MNVEELVGKEKDYRQVKIVIGGAGEEYDSSNAHFEVASVVSEHGFVYLLIPDSVAEGYRRQGRRELQSEFRQLMNSARA